MKIGVIGTGNVGQSIGGLLSRAGHDVRFGSRNPGKEEVGSLPGPVGTVVDAAEFGDVILCAAPYGIWPELARELKSKVGGKVLIDAANPYPERDGAFAQASIDAGEGAGVPVADLLPDARLVRAFNSVPWPAMVAEAGREGQRIAIPLAGDNAAARAVVAELIQDAGFEPVDAGVLAQARLFDPGGPAYNQAAPAIQMRQALRLEPPR